ncbi:hypothetical protein BU17DRAFT_90643 [Hysterangium stoloniferum]|nr:hypothetical protein BU17DRAFT_90643 [Hysterangium stoloniferum]
MPNTIFHKISLKSLRKRFKKDESSSEYESVPPLRNKNGVDKEEHSSEAVNSKDNTVTNETSLIVSNSPSLDAPGQQVVAGEDGFASAAWTAVYGSPPPPLEAGPETERLGNNSTSEEAANVEKAAAVVTATVSFLDTTSGLDVVKDGAIKISEVSTVFLSALDEVAEIHSFIKGPILVFKAVWTLEMKRRENDQKIKALYAEMRDMMVVLLQLKNVKDVTEVGPDGRTIAGRMQELSEDTTKKIMSCANACDTYAKKKLLVKVLVGPIWENRLADFMSLFFKRRQEFQLALAIHTTRGVDAANETLADLKAIMIQILRMKSVSSEEEDMARLVEKRGGVEAVQNDKKALEELNKLAQKNATGFKLPGRELIAAASQKTSNKNDMQELLEDLYTSPEEAMEKNEKTFLSKLEIQQRQIEQLTHTVKREGDRIISAITSGPHDRIRDPDVYNIWKEMNWRGSVKARHFVMNLRDYFNEKWNVDYLDGTTSKADVGHEKGPDDQWALAYINTTRLQPISEAFDDDASGFITLSEVNTFTTSRPMGWSLPHWIAYWAVGWHMTLTDYASKIQELTGKMFAILPSIRSENLGFVNNYLNQVYPTVTTLQASVNVSYRNEGLKARFQSYVDAEEERLKNNLQAIKYDIDESDTLALVTGPGRIEKYLFPILYLLLQRHFEIFRDAAGTIEWVFNSVAERYNVLYSIFKQQKLDEKHQFRVFAHGTFEYWHDPSGLWAPAIVRQSDLEEFPYNEALEIQDIKADAVCNYPLGDQKFGYITYETHESDTSAQANADISSILKPILGVWNGYNYCGEYATLMTPYVFRATGQNNEFEASGKVANREFTVVGNCEVGEAPNFISVKFSKIYPDGVYPQQYFTGRFDASTETIQGRLASTPDDPPTSWTFLFKRVPADIFRFYPPPKFLEDNKARALWQFAINAIQSQVRRQLWSWSLFKERRDSRKKFIQFLVRTLAGKRLKDSEQAEYNVLQRGFMPNDATLCFLLASHQIRIAVKHGSQTDMAAITDTWNTVDLCDKPECMAAEVNRDDLTMVHRPTHDLVKVRRVVHVRQHGQFERNSTAALEKSRNILRSGDANQAENIGKGEEENQGGSIGKGEAENQGVNIGKGEEGNQDGNIGKGEAENPGGNIGKGGGKAEKAKCTLCTKEVSQPCWFCVQCEKPTFLCYDCDNGGVASFKDHNYYTHDLVRCQELVKDEDPSIEGRLMGLKERLSNMDERLIAMEKSHSKTNTMLTDMEKSHSKTNIILQMILEKIGVDIPETE